MSDHLAPIPWLDVLLLVALICLNGVLAMREPPGYLGAIVRRMKQHAGAGAMETAGIA